MKVTQEDINAIQQLIATGDVVLSDSRAVFRDVYKRDTTLTDEQLIVAIAATDDDDPDLFCDNVLQMEGEIAGH